MAVSVTVIVPVYNAEEFLPSCLSHLAVSTASLGEIIVVDDGSTDGSAGIAAEFGAVVLHSGGRKGPAHARNLAARSARGDILFFIDSDVCVYPDTIARCIAAFEDHPDVDAVIGSYDDSPGCPDFISQYKNLMHCYVHQHGLSQASTFWSGCGAIRKQVFLEHSGFDEALYARPAIEDIELGYRLRRAGHEILLDRDVRVKHLKRWTFLGLVKTDIFDRGIPWTELILREGSMPNDLNIQLSQRVSVALVFLLLLAAFVTAVYWRGYFLTPLFAVVFFLLSRYWVEAASDRHSNVAIAILTGAVALIVWLAMLHEMSYLVPLVVLGYLLLFVRHRYWRSDKPYRHRLGQTISLYVILLALLALASLPGHYLVFTVCAIGTILFLLNINFYVFLAERKGRMFAVAAIPFHLLYHFYNGLSFAIGAVRFFWRSLVRHKTVATKPHS